MNSGGSLRNEKNSHHFINFSYFQVYNITFDSSVVSRERVEILYLWLVFVKDFLKESQKKPFFRYKIKDIFFYFAI